MAKKKAKATSLEREYAKQRSRLQQTIRNAEKRGYMFSANAIPKQPKKITQKSVERLQKIKPKDLYEKSIYLNPKTGLPVAGKEGLRLEREQRTEKAKQTRQKNKQKTPKQDTQHQEQYYPNGGDIIADNIVDDLIRKFQEPEPTVFPYTKKLARQMSDLIQARRYSKTTLLGLTYQVINDIGKSALGWRLEDRLNDVEDAMDTMLYRASSADDVISACSELAEIIKGAPLSFAERQDLAEQEEYNESYELPQ